MPDIVVLNPESRSSLGTLVDDYLLSCRAGGLSRTTVIRSYGYPLRDVLLPWCQKHQTESVGQLWDRVVDTFTVELLEHGNKRGQLSKNSAHSYLRAIRGFLIWFEREGDEVLAMPSLPRLP